MAKAAPKDDMLVLCARCGLRPFDDYVVRDGDMVVITEQGQRRLEEAVAADPSLERPVLDTAGADIDKLLDMARYRARCGAG